MRLIRINIYASEFSWIMFKWFKVRGYPQGVFFALMFLAIGPALDSIMKFLGTRLPPIEVIFFRFLFATISLIPFLCAKREFRVVSMKNMHLNVIRGILGFIAFVGCIYSVKMLPLSEVTTIFWTMPLFSILLSFLILRERVTKARAAATGIGFLGLYFFLCPDGISVQMAVFVPIGTAFLFSLQDIIIRKVADKESKTMMIFYFGFVTVVMSAIPTILVFKMPDMREFCLLILLGVGANLMQYFIFKAYSSAEVSALAPFRYTELIFATGFGYFIFGEIPGVNVFYAAMIIIPTTLYLVYSEIRCKKYESDTDVG